MKRLKFLPSILMLALCVGVLAMGVYSASPASNQISGSIEVSASKHPVKIEVMRGETTIATYPEVRGGVAISMPNIEFDASNANSPEDVEEIVYTIRVTNLSSTPLGVYFLKDELTAEQEYANMNNVRLNGEVKTQDNKDLANVEFTGYMPLDVNGNTNGNTDYVDMEMHFSLKALYDTNITSEQFNFKLNIEEYQENSTDGLIKLALNKKTISPGDKASTMTNIMLTSNITGIGSAGFISCKSLTSISIPYGVTSIGSSAFSGCTSLVSISIPNSVTSIGGEAFDGCSNLNYNIYENVNYLGNSTNPYLVLVAPINKTMDTFTINNNTKFIYDFAFNGCTSLTSISIPEGVTSIGYSAFYDCTQLSSISIPNSVTSIDDSAFSGCSNLNYNIDANGKYLGNSTNPYLVLMDTTITDMDTFTINNKTKFIYGNAISSCPSLSSISIPDGVTSIGFWAFAGCTSLSNISIPNSVTRIGENVLGGCSNLSSITYKGTMAQWNAISKASSLNPFAGTYTIHCTDGDIAES